MDTLVEKHKSGLNQSGILRAAVYSVIQFVILLAGYQILSEQERTNAGIDLDGYRHGR